MSLTLIARCISDKHNDIFVLGEKPITQKDFDAITPAKEYNGLVIDLEDEEGVIDTKHADAQLIEQAFGVKVLNEDILAEQSNHRFIEGLLAQGLNPDEELAKVNQTLFNR